MKLFGCFSATVLVIWPLLQALVVLFEDWTFAHSIGFYFSPCNIAMFYNFEVVFSQFV